MSLSQLDYTQACVAGQEIFVFGAEAHPGAPVVFVTHGRSGNVTGTFGWCRELADAGLIAIGVEQCNHGRLRVDPEWNSDNRAWYQYGLLLGTARNVSQLIDLLPASLGIDTTRVGMTGGSMGGHATLLAMAIDPRINVGAPLIGSGDYCRLMELRAILKDIPAAEFAQFYPPTLDAVVQRYDPINNLAAFTDRPLLLMNGEDDNLVQLECNQRFEAAVRPHYTRQERLKLSVYPGVAHACPPEMWAEAKAWLVRWLQQ